MNYAHIKNMKISKLIIGTDYYGTGNHEKTYTDILDLYIENGGNMIDTARLYTGGKSEEFIGKYLKSKKLNNKILIATKAGHPPVDNMNCSRLSKKEIESDVETSLKALKIECIDILWLHRDDENINPEPIIDTLNGLVKSGKIKHYGASNWKSERIELANKYAHSVNSEGFIASQIQWSLAKPRYCYDKTLVIMNDNERRYYKQTKLPVFAFSSQAKGFFEKYAVGSLSEKAKDRFYSDENIKIFENLKNSSRISGKSISALSLEYLTDNKDFETFAIIGPSHVDQLKQSLNIK